MDIVRRQSCRNMSDNAAWHLDFKYKLVKHDFLQVVPLIDAVSTPCCSNDPKTIEETLLVMCLNKLLMIALLYSKLEVTRDQKID